MDWDSPTTKKHIAEAETQGCKLLGAGGSANWRLYTLPCGHEKEVQLTNMRRGRVRCGICLTGKLTQDAEALGCKLLGAGKNSQYRLYALPCGHEQEVDPGNMRKAQFRCSICSNEMLNQEAKAQGCKLLGPGKSAHYRLYKLSCGHEREGQLASMRKGQVRCRICLNTTLNQEAKAQGCKLLGPGKNRQNRIYVLPCGHEQEVTTSWMRRGRFECKICFAQKLKKEAETQGCQLLGAGKNNSYRLYALPCGHKRHVTLHSMRSGSFICQTCEESSRTQPSSLYLLHISVDADAWLKLGYAKSVSFRTSRYGLPQSAEVTTIKSLPFDTGNEAHAIESDIHLRYKRKRLPQKHMKAFHTKSGFEECYPVTMLETLLAELEAAAGEPERFSVDS